MGLLVDVSIALPIGLIYNIFFHKIGEIINNNLDYREKIQRNLILTFIGGVVAIILASSIFKDNKKYKNRAIRYGLYIGSFLLLFHTLLYNWHILANDTKLFIMTATMVILIWYSYKNNVTEDSDSGNDDSSHMSNLLPMTLIDYPENFKVKQ